MPMGGDGWFEPSQPIRVEGGIKARTQRGSIGAAWWSRRFIDILEHICDKGRLTRGRAYARKGQVLTLVITPGVVTAKVQGSRPSPYAVSVRISAYGEREWARLESALAEQAIYRAQLLAGEMPPEIEDVFAGCGLPLFPDRAPVPGTRSRSGKDGGHGDLDMGCSCPDWGFPCKHLSAVLYVLAEAFDDDPFLVLAWRGRDKDSLLASLRLTGEADQTPDPLAVEDVPFADRLTDFYAGGSSLALRGPGSSHARHGGVPGPPGTALAPPDLLLRIADPPPIRVRGTSLTEVLGPAYHHLATPPGE
jgi:uncharacterized Zn finger protein